MFKWLHFKIETTCKGGIFISVCFIYLFVYLFIYLLIYLFICLIIFLKKPEYLQKYVIKNFGLKFQRKISCWKYGKHNLQSLSFAHSPSIPEIQHNYVPFRCLQYEIDLKEANVTKYQSVIKKRHTVELNYHGFLER